MLKLIPTTMLTTLRAGNSQSVNGSWRRDAVFYFGIALLFCWQLICPGFHFYRWDTAIYSWPLLAEIREQALSGNIPFWSPSTCCGTDLLANINMGVLYPFRFLTCVLPLSAGYSIMVLLHVWMSLFAMHVLVHRTLRLSFLAAFIAAIAYAASGYSRAMWDSINFVAMPWIPMGISALLMARNSNRVITSILCTGGCMSMLLLGGDFQAAALWPAFAVLLIICLPERKKLIIPFAAGIALAILLSAPQLLPTYKASLLSYRAGGLSFVDGAERSFHPVRLIELAAPYIFGTHGGWLAPSLFGTGATKLSPWTASFHLGILTLLPIALAWRKRRNPMVIWAILTFVTSIVIAFGRFTPVFSIWRMLPVIGSFRYPEKYLLWSTLALSLLAGYGGQVFTVIWRKAQFQSARRISVLLWIFMIILAEGAAFLLIRNICGSSPFIALWFGRGMLCFTVITVALLAALKLSHKDKRLKALAGVFLISSLVSWYSEQPLTNQWNPLDPPPAAMMIRNSGAPSGRVLTDNAVRVTPLPGQWPSFDSEITKAAILPSKLAFNSPRAWGLRTADGFSPIEAGHMRKIRTSLALPGSSIAPIDDFGRFCLDSCAQWILTTEERAYRLMDILPDAQKHYSWGTGEKTILLHRPEVTEAKFIGQSIEHGTEKEPEVEGVWRLRPNTIRVDITPGISKIMAVSETYSPGWSAVDETGKPARLFRLNEAFIGVSVPEGSNQIRMKYIPQGWTAGLLAGAGGLLIIICLFIFDMRKQIPKVITSPAMPIICSCLIFAVLGLSARNHWACTYDEGFHLARGMGRIVKGDSRLNYYHPPLQNAVCAYFAYQAYGDKVRFPESRGWKSGDIQRFATEFTYANRHIFPGLIRASRWGSLLFALLLCGAGTYWAFTAGGALAGWLAACGLACNANFLTHGNLTTTDAGVTAIVLCASMFAWLHNRSGSLRHIYTAGILFALSALLKFTGLVWLFAFLFIALPLFAAKAKSLKPMLVLPVTLLAFLSLLVLSYGIEAQAIRVQDPAWIAGARCMAGRYIEGLFRQGSHILSGHRAYFAGTQFYRSSWYHMPMTLLLKTPAAWALAALISLIALSIRAARKPASLIPFIPVICFSILFVTTNKLALGIRHLLPILPFIILAPCVIISGIRKHSISGAVSFVLVTISCVTIIQSFPRYLSYYPLWAGGLDKGHYWAVDSNYDWGQELDDLESKWAGIIKRNNGQPPHLLYFGFADPRVIYGMKTSEPSWGGYMHWYNMAHGEKEDRDQWLKSLQNIDGTSASSISMLKLSPFGTDLKYITDRDLIQRVNYSLFLYGTGKKDFTNK